MGRIDVTHNHYTPLWEPGRDKGEPAHPSEREKKLAEELETRLASSLEQIRARLNGAASRRLLTDHPAGTGNKLDILA